jgi:uncharacterized protein (TIGR02271 family)
MNPDEELVIPVIQEELHVDAVRVPTGGVRITKKVIGEEQLIEQELLRSRADIKRVAVNRPVDGPQEVKTVGDTVIIPVVEEVIKIERQWILKEEIHITRVEEKELYQDKVVVNHEEVTIERFTNTENK